MTNARRIEPERLPNEELTLLLFGYLRSLGARADLAVLGDWLTQLLPPGASLSATIPREALPCPNLADVAYAFRTLVSSELRSKAGAIYTPPALAEFMVAARLSELPLAQIPTVLDPACGSGIFLITAGENYFKRHPSAARTINSRAAYISSSLFGVDQSPAAVATTRFFLQLLCLPPNLTTLPTKNELPRFQHNIIVGNALIGPAKQQELFAPINEIERNTLDLTAELKPLGTHQGFDLVVGNPPYGLSRDEQISADENKALRERYSSVLRGRVNKYLLFMARGFELLAPKGTLSLIVPNSWLGIGEAAGIRELLFQNRAIHELEIFTESPFAGESVETVVFVARRGLPASEIKIAHRADVRSDPIFTTKLDYFDWAEEASRMLPITWIAGLPELLKHVASVSRPLIQCPAHFTPRIALQVYALGRGEPKQTKETVKTHPFHHTELQDAATDIPYLEGADLKRFSLTWSMQYLRYGPWISEFQPRERYAGPRVLVREILNRQPYLITAAATDQPYVYNRSILHIAANNRDGIIDAQALSALLSSSFGSMWLLARGRKAQRKLFPKLVLDDLSRFPIPKRFDEMKALLASAVHKLQDPALDDSTRVLAEAELNQCVLDCYKIDTQQVAVMTSYLGHMGQLFK